jgi:Pyridoxamine 5'-phosphate oxidase
VEPWTWDEIASQLAPERQYWLATTRPDGSPHTAPVWGVVVRADLYLYSERRTAKAANLAADPRAVVHLESGENVLIIRGTMVDLGGPTECPEVVAALDAKYTRAADRPYLPSADPSFDVVWRLVPSEAMGWQIDPYEASQRRWRRG